MLSTGSRENLLWLARRSQAARQAGDALAQHIIQHRDQYPDLVSLALAVLEPVVDCDQEAA